MRLAARAALLAFCLVLVPACLVLAQQHARTLRPIPTDDYFQIRAVSDPDLSPDGRFPGRDFLPHRRQARANHPHKRRPDEPAQTSAGNMCTLKARTARPSLAICTSRSAMCPARSTRPFFGPMGGRCGPITPNLPICRSFTPPTAMSAFSRTPALERLWAGVRAGHLGRLGQQGLPR